MRKLKGRLRAAAIRHDDFDHALDIVLAHLAPRHWTAEQKHAWRLYWKLQCPPHAYRPLAEEK